MTIYTSKQSEPNWKTDVLTHFLRQYATTGVYSSMYEQKRNVCLSTILKRIEMNICISTIFDLRPIWGWCSWEDTCRGLQDNEIVNVAWRIEEPLKITPPQELKAIYVLVVKPASRVSHWWRLANDKRFVWWCLFISPTTPNKVVTDLDGNVKRLAGRSLL